MWLVPSNNSAHRYLAQANTHVSTRYLEAVLLGTDYRLDRKRELFGIPNVSHRMTHEFGQNFLCLYVSSPVAFEDLSRMEAFSK